MLFLALAAPLLALVALPQLVVNLFASSAPPGFEYHYAVLLVPVLVAASLLGLALCAPGTCPAASAACWPTRGGWRPCGGGHAPDGGVPRAAPPLGMAPRGMGAPR